MYSPSQLSSTCTLVAAIVRNGKEHHFTNSSPTQLHAYLNSADAASTVVPFEIEDVRADVVNNAGNAKKADSVALPTAPVVAMIIVLVGLILTITAVCMLFVQRRERLRLPQASKLKGRRTTRLTNTQLPHTNPRWSIVSRYQNENLNPGNSETTGHQHDQIEKKCPIKVVTQYRLEASGPTMGIFLLVQMKKNPADNLNENETYWWDQAGSQVDNVKSVPVPGKLVRVLSGRFGMSKSELY